MINYSTRLIVAVCLFVGSMWAANDPFVGKWKLNPSKSQLTDQMKVEAAGANKYTFDFGGGAETVVADGTDQPGNFGTTLAIAVMAPDTWKVVRKKGGRTLITGVWKLSEDGKTLTDSFTGNQANGSTLNLHYVYKRLEAGSGFPGTWESTSEKVNSVFEIAIEPYKDNGLSFINPAQKSTQSMDFDGKDYPNQGPNVVAGAASSGHRVDEHTLNITDKINSKVTDTRQLILAPDQKTLTMTVRPIGRNKPNILVFERE